MYTYIYTHVLCNDEMHLPNPVPLNLFLGSSRMPTDVSPDVRNNTPGQAAKLNVNLSKLVADQSDDVGILFGTRPPTLQYAVDRVGVHMSWVQRIPNSS